MFLQTLNNILSNYTLKSPIINGKLTVYARMLVFVYNNPTKTFTKTQLLLIGRKLKLVNINEKLMPGNCTGTFAILNQNNLITYNSKSKRLEVGYNLNEYVETYILPFIKV